MSTMQSFIPSEKFAEKVLSLIDKVIDWMGLESSASVRSIVYLVSIVAIAILSGLLVQWIITVIARRIIAVRFKSLSNELEQDHVLRHCGRVIPPLVLLSLIPVAFTSDHPITRILIMATVIYTIIAVVIAVNSIFGLIWHRYDTRHNDKNLPLRGVLDISRGTMWVIAVIIIISMLVNKSPIALLTGLGAFAAVLLLIFKNSILGLVAGVQLSENDMLRVGDWISVPGTKVNGIVIDVSLVVVKVRNWNNTVSMLPPYSLVSGEFINWRYMKAGGSRQIEMSMLIDISTVRPLSDDELHAIQEKLPRLKNFIDVKIAQRNAGKEKNVFNAEAPAPGTIDTNLGLLRAYAYLYIDSHPYVLKERMHMVRILQPGQYGFPLQIFCYLTTSDWPAYEGIQAEIFEHLAAIAPTLGLSAYQMPSTRSVYNIGANPQQGAPYFGQDPVSSPYDDPSTNVMPS